MFQHSRAHLAALASYAGLTAVALNNLVRHFATAVPATVNADYAIFYWNLWWAKHALFSLRRDPMFSNYVLYPYEVNLALHTHTFTLGFLTAPLQAVLDLRLIYNGIIVLSFVAAGYFTFLFLRRHVRHDGLAWLGGALFAFTPMTLARAAVAHLNLLQAWWLPVLLIEWESMLATASWRRRVAAAAGFGFSIYLTWMTDAQFIVWIASLVAPYAVYTWLARCNARGRLDVLALSLVAAVCVLGPALIEPLPALWQARGDVFPVVQAETAQFYSFQLPWLVQPDPDRMGDSIGQVIPLLTALGLVLVRPDRQRGFWLALGLALLILALGPYWAGANIPLPYLLLHGLMGGQYRTPMRFMTPATLAAIIFSVLSLAVWLERRKDAHPSLDRWLLGALAIGAVFNSGLGAPFPVAFPPDYRIYHELGRDPDVYTLLQVPVGPASGFSEFGSAPDLQYYAYIHHKRILNGIVSRIPSGWLDKYANSPLLQGLTGQADLPPLDLASRELEEKLTKWDMRYVLVHRDRLPPESVRPIVQFLNVQPILCLVDEEQALLAYRRISAWGDCPRPEQSALPAQAGALRLTLGQPGDARYVGPGWYAEENIGGLQGRWAGDAPTSTLRMLLPRRDLRVSFNAFAYPAQQAVTVRVNGQVLARVELTQSPQTYQFDLPMTALPAAGPVTIELTHSHLLSAFESTNGQIADRRPLAAAYMWFEFSPP